MRLVRGDESVEVDDGNGTLVGYYLGEGFTADAVAGEVSSFPRVFDGDRYVDEPAEQSASVQVEQLPDGEYVDLSGPARSAAGSGSPSVAVDAPADGTSVEIGND